MRRPKLLKAKKAVVFNVLVVLLTIMALVYAYIMLGQKTKLDRPLGPPQMEMFMTYQEGDKALSYIDQAGNIALREASFEFQENGGIDPNVCDEYYGFNKWDPDKPDCMPDLDSLYDQISDLFSQKLSPYLDAYPGISFMRYYVSTPAQQAQQQQTLTDNTSTLIGGLVPIPESDSIRCSDSVKARDTCKIKPELVPEFQKISDVLNDGEVLEIFDASRDFNAQKNAFLDKYVKNGAPPVCGPSKYKTSIHDAIGEPPEKDNEEYHKKVDKYLEDNPNIKEAINDPNNFDTCPHIIGKAVDAHILDGAGEKKSHDYLREVMCKAGWVNYGKEWWHYEYGTKLWNDNRPDNVPDGLVGSPSNNNYNKNCYYSTLK